MSEFSKEDLERKITLAAGDMAPEELAHWLAVKVQHREMEGMWHG